MSLRSRSVSLRVASGLTDSPELKALAQRGKYIMLFGIHCLAKQSRKTLSVWTQEAKAQEFDQFNCHDNSWEIGMVIEIGK